MPELSKLLEDYGEVAALCQRLELGYATLVVILEDSKTWFGEDPGPNHRVRLKKLALRTLGQSIHLLSDSIDVPELRDVLRPAVDARNELHHRFFLTYDIENPAIDVAAAEERLRVLRETLAQAHDSVYEILTPILDAWDRSSDGA